MAYKVLSTIPICIFTSLVGVCLIYRTFDSLTILFRGTSSKQLRKKRTNDSKDTCFCSCCNLKDDNEVIFSMSDLMYVIDLLKSRETQESSKNQKPTFKKEELKNMGNSYVKVKAKSESKMKNFFRKYIYDWDPNFHFTSRFVNTIFVANIAMYYFFLAWLYELTVLITFIAPSFTNQYVNLSTNTINLDNLIPGLPIGDISIPVQILTFLPQFRISSILLIMVPIFGTMVICLLQMFLFVKESKRFIIELYKGKCEFIVKLENVNNRTIFGNSFHFGGYV